MGTLVVLWIGRCWYFSSDVRLVVMVKLMIQKIGKIGKGRVKREQGV